MTTKEHFLSQRQRYQPISLPQHFSDEEVARDWTLLREIDKRSRGIGRILVYTWRSKSVRYGCMVLTLPI